jgi:hypothetical protein
VRLDLSTTLDLVAVGTTESAQAAARLVSRLNDEMNGLHARASLAMLGLLPVLEGAKVASHGTRVQGEIHLSVAQQQQIAERLTVVARALGQRNARRTSASGAPQGPAGPGTTGTGTNHGGPGPHE